MSNKVSVEGISRVPESSWQLPYNELYVRLGCAACPHAVCFKARGITAVTPDYSINPEAAQDLSGCIDDVDKKSEVQRGFSSTWDEPCEHPCPQVDEMELAVGLLNEVFESNLEFPKG